MRLFQSKNRRKTESILTDDLKLALGDSTDTNENSNSSNKKGVLLGWRYWNINNDMLLSPYMGYVWNNYLSSVDSLRGSEGLYAYNSFSFLGPGDIRYPIVGLVAASGEIEMHETGFRAKHMQIIALAPGRRANPAHSLKYHNNTPGLPLEYNLKFELELEGKESIAFLDSPFSLIDFGLDLAEKNDFTLCGLEEQKTRKPQLVVSNKSGEDYLSEYKIDNTTISLKNDLIHSNSDRPAFVGEDGSQKWYREGVLHRTNGPAVIGPDIGSDSRFERRSEEWYQYGLLHREDGPAVIDMYGNKFWYRDGVPHRDDDLPAIIRVDGEQEWYQKGEPKRAGGDPQKIFANGSKLYLSAHKDYYLIVDIEGVKHWFENSKLVRTEYPCESSVENSVQELKEKVDAMSIQIEKLSAQLEKACSLND